MKDLSWYWHRLTAMSPGEMGLHFRKKLLQRKEMSSPREFPSAPLARNSAFPKLLYPTSAPQELIAAREQQWAQIRQGKWEAFASIPLQVDLPPHWQKDYKAGVDLESSEHGFKLNHRKLPNGADVKFIWELSRWYEITRMAQYAWLSNSEEAGLTCKKLLRDWVTKNPPYRGYNWTSALESGMRLIQIVWIDALLEKFHLPNWDVVINSVVYPNLHYTWNFRSFGSSANNHLLGELAGTILAVTRWPQLAKEFVSLETLRGLMDKEILAQFAFDGGNLEQALNYQLFSFEFCWLSKMALEASRLPLNPEAEQRLHLAGKFFAEMHVADNSWPYGDSDDAFVLPFFLQNRTYREEWQAWFRNEPAGEAIQFWLGNFSKQPVNSNTSDRIVYSESGHAIQRKNDWIVRWDFSPLGLGSTAAHGHIDALHVSLWFKGAAIIVDPGTGAYYGDLPLRNLLASPEVHNGPWPISWNKPKRLGPFLWSEHHPRPQWSEPSANQCVMEWNPGCGTIKRITEAVPGGWEILDSYEPAANGPKNFEIYWQVTPGLQVEPTSKPNVFLVRNAKTAIEVSFSENFGKIEIVQPSGEKSPPVLARGVCSESFRSVSYGPGIKLTGTGGNSCLFKSRFIALSPQ